MFSGGRMIVTVDANNVPFVHMPSGQLWEFVEFMALHRHAVEYGFRGDDFLVKFDRLSAEQAQRVVDEFASQRQRAWAGAGERVGDRNSEMQMVG